jgi:hypothetical protein
MEPEPSTVPEGRDPRAQYEPVPDEHAHGRGLVRSPQSVLAAVLALGACAALLAIVRSTRWTMDADESVHAVEALRLHEDVTDGRLGDLLHDAYFPERWHPPVDDHLRWYPPVHALCTLPFFALLGPSDFSARLPSVVFLLGSCACAFFLGARLARAHAAWGGLAAVALFLAAPNLLTFSAQSLTEGAALFFALLAFLAYLRSLEAGHPRGRALVTGLALGAAALAKYDHGGFEIACLCLCELLRARFRPRALLASGAAWIFGPAILLIGLWFAHPDKLDALRDSLAHPFYGTPRSALLDLALTGVVEYGSSLATAALALAAFFALRRRLGEPHLRAAWLWCGCALVFYALRGRFHFRYNFVEAPLFLLLLAAALPEGVDRLAAVLVAPRSRRRERGWTLLWVGSAALLGFGLLVCARPAALFDATRAPLDWLWGLRDDHWGMQLEPRAHIDRLAADYASFAVFLGGSLAALGLAVFLLATTALAGAVRPLARRGARIAIGIALLVALSPGAIALYDDLRERVEWELEGHPELNDVHAFVAVHAPPRATILLGGAWDQLPNNALRWYLTTSPAARPASTAPRPLLGDRSVVGDMIGSVVFPPEPRIAYWAERLALAPAAELPELVVLIVPGPRFLYHALMGPEAAVYRSVLDQRGSHAVIAERHFPTLDCVVTILARTPGSKPIAAHSELLRSHGIDPVDPRRPGQPSSRAWAGEHGWIVRDEALRYFVRR